MEEFRGYDKIESFLRNPEGETDAFWEAGPLLWVDWREYDEDIIGMVNEMLPEDARFAFEVRDSALPRGVDILLKRGGRATAIPYGPDRLDRDVTLKAVQSFIAPDWQLRCFVPSMKNDTLGFCLLPAAQWRELETAFGTGVVARYFRLVTPAGRLFG